MQLIKKTRLKRFFSYYKPYKGLFVADVSCAAAVTVMALTVPMLARYITKDILEGSFSDPVGMIFKTGAIIALIVAAQAGCTFFYDYRGHAMGAMMERDIRRELFDHLQKLNFSFYDEHKTGALMPRVTSDLLWLTELYHHVPEDLIINIIKFVGAFAILYAINPLLTLLMFIFVPVFAAYTFFFNRKLKKAYKANLERISDINASLEDSLSGIRVSQSFANEDMEREKFKHQSERFLDSRKNIYRNEAYLYGGTTALSQLMTAAVVVLGGAMAVQNGLDLADLITFMLYAGYLVDPIRNFINMSRLYQEGIAGFNRFMDIMEIEPDIGDSANAVEIAEIRGGVEFKNVGFKYREGHDYVLRGISFEVKPGDYIAVVGTSGVGKTTLCSLIPRFYEANEGEILLDGKNVKDIKLHSLRKNIGIVQQDVYLFSGTVLENILYGKPGASPEEAMEAARKANAHDFIMGLPDGYATDIGPRGVKLSGGQRQRVSIARAFLKNPPVIIFDEATSALDYESETVVKESLEKLAEGRTAFVIAHRLSTIRNAKRIMVLSESGIAEQGTHDELIALGGVYYNLYSPEPA